MHTLPEGYTLLDSHRLGVWLAKNSSKLKATGASARDLTKAKPLLDAMMPRTLRRAGVSKLPMRIPAGRMLFSVYFVDKSSKGSVVTWAVVHRYHYDERTKYRSIVKVWDTTPWEEVRTAFVGPICASVNRSVWIGPLPPETSAEEAVRALAPKSLLERCPTLRTTPHL